MFYEVCLLWCNIFKKYEISASYLFFVYDLLHCNYKILTEQRYFCRNKLILVTNYKFSVLRRGPVLSTYQSFRLPYFTPLLPNNAIILASNLIPARMAELGGADSAHLHSSRAGIDVSAPSPPHPTTGTSSYSLLLLYSEAIPQLSYPHMHMHSASSIWYNHRLNMELDL